MNSQKLIRIQPQISQRLKGPGGLSDQAEGAWECLSSESPNLRPVQ